MVSLGSLVPILLFLRATNGDTNTTTVSTTSITSGSINPTNFTEKPTARAVFWTPTPSVNSSRTTWSWGKSNGQVNHTSPSSVSTSTSKQKSPSSLLSALMSWPSIFQSQSSTLPNGSWVSTNFTGRTQGRHAGWTDKYSGMDGYGSSGHYHQYPQHPPYGAHSPFASYKPHMHEIPKSYGEYYYKEKHTHYLYAPPPPPLPPDGALEPVYQPHAKVAVTADFVELKCSVYGDYIPHIRWAKLAGHNHAGHVLFTTIAEGPHVIYDNYHYAVRSDGRHSRLIIREPDPRVHYGTYQCQVMVPGEHTHVTKDDFVVGHPAY